MLLAGRGLEEVDDRAQLAHAERLAPDDVEHRALIASRQARHVPRRGGAEQTQTQVLLGLLAELLDQPQPAAHPARGVAHKLGHLHLRQLVFAHQGEDDPGLLQFAGPARRAIEAEHRRLGALVVGLQHAGADARLHAQLPEGGEPLVPVDQFVVARMHEDHHRRDLAVAPQRGQHGLLRLRLTQAKPGKPVPDLIDVETDHGCLFGHGALRRPVSTPPAHSRVSRAEKLRAQQSAVQYFRLSARAYPRVLGAAQHRGAHATAARAATPVPSRSDRTSCRSAAGGSAPLDRTGRSSRGGRKKSHPPRSVMTLARGCRPRFRLLSGRSRAPSMAAGRRHESLWSARSPPLWSPPHPSRAPQPRARPTSPRCLGRGPPLRSAEPVGLVRSSPRLASPRPTPIRLARLPPRPLPGGGHASR